MNAETSTRPFQVDDRVMVGCPDGEIRPGTVYQFETFPSHPDEATMWVRLDVPYDRNDTRHTVGFVWVSGDHTAVTGPVSLGAHCELIDPANPPTAAPQDHGPLAAVLSDRTLAKVLSRPAHVPSLVVLDAAEHLADVATTVLATLGAEAKHAPLSALGQALADYRAAVQS